MIVTNITKKVTIFGVCVLLLFFIIQRFFVFQNDKFEQFIGALNYPFITLSEKVTAPIQHFFQKRASYDQLEQNYKKVSEEYSSLLEKYVHLNATKHYSEESSEIIQFKERFAPQNGILARVIYRHMSPHEHYFFVNQGRRDGIQKDMIAFYQAQLLGRVSEVYPYHSKVVLISDSHSKIAAYTEKDNTQGIVEGTNSANKCSLNYVNHLTPVQDGDLVFSSGEGMIFPEGFAIGTIAEHHLENLSQSITINTLIDFTKCTFCVLLDRSLIQNF